MKNCLLITFDYHKENESPVSFAVANILAYIQMSLSVKNQITSSFSFDMNRPSEIFTTQLDSLFLRWDLNNYQVFAVSLYCWCKNYVNPLIQQIKKRIPNAIIVLGGYEVNLIDQNLLIKNYPECDVFIAGQAEKSMVSLINGEIPIEKFMNQSFDISMIPNLYETGIVSIKRNDKIRIESKRGCNYNCSFCAHRDIINNRIVEKDIDSILKELVYLNSQDISKLNFVDPTFNIGSNYLIILEKMVEMKFRHTVSFQVRFELIVGKEGKIFLDLVQQLNCILEFGLQTIDPVESKIINRLNNLKQVKRILRILNKKSIKYFISLIYGLPNQTLKSFKNNIKFLQRHKCDNIECNPLMLISGTRLHYDKDKYGLIEENINGIDYVVSSSCFSKNDYLKMKSIAESLNIKRT